MLDSPTVALPIVTPKRHRKRWGRKRTVATIVAALVGLPAIAFAAIYLFGTIYGSTNVIASDATIQLTSVSGTPATSGGVDCGSTVRHGSNQGDVTDTNVDVLARAFLVKVNGQLPGAATDLGSCVVTLVVKNASTAPNTLATVSAKVDPQSVPTGWTVTPSDPVTINNTESATLTLTIHAAGNATVGGGTFPGSLNVTIPPAGS